mgnify:CR=1 FL=1
MKKIICILFLTIIVTSTSALAETTTILSTKNKFGGKTIKVTYSPLDEARYDEGMAKIIIFLDGNGNKVRIDCFYTDEDAKKRGVGKVIAYFDEYGETKRSEFYDQHGKRITHYKDGSPIK